MPIDDARRVWDAALGRLQLQVTRPSYDTWLRDTVGLSFEDDGLVIGVPTTFAAQWLEQRLRGIVETAVASVARQQLAISFRVAALPSPVRADAPKPGAVPIPVGQTASAETSPPSVAARSAHFIARYTFRSFVVGPGNRLAHASAMAVAEAPGDTYNPLFLHSGPGLGKTHLLHAIAQEARGAGRSVHYVSAEQFTNEFLSAIRERRTAEFRDRYRAVDLLLIDDIQFISGKEGTQEGFFHTFNALHEAGRQIVLTCDRPPSALPLLEERLRSRFEWGLIADISLPDLETRLTILHQRTCNASLSIPQEVLEYIAATELGNIRRLEGHLNKVLALAEFTGQPITIDLARDVLPPPTPGTEPPTPKAIIAAVADFHGLPPASLVSKRRDKMVATARQITMHLLSRLLHLPPEAIGQALGGRDRSTVLYSLRKVAQQLASDSQLAATIKQLEAAVQQPSNSTG